MSGETKPVAVVVIPTYNEADSIGEMVETLCGQIFPAIDDWRCLLLIVDDTSPDGTYKIVQNLQKKYQNLRLLLNSEKIGIGGAYVKGFQHAMDDLKAEVIVEFDGDFQHPPKIIPEMLEQISRGADYVLGSRNIKGGSVPKSWGLKRLFFSKFGGGVVARMILFFPTKYFFKITDPTTGCRASRVKGFVDQMDFRHLYSYQFGYKMDFLYKMVKLGAKVKEVPLEFGLRQTGESKITNQTAKDIWKTIILLRWNDPATKKFIKFGTVGFTGFLVNSFALEFFRRVSISSSLANGFSYLEGSSMSLLATPSAWAGGLAAELAIISNYLLNNFWTFAAEKITHPMKMVLKFLQFNLTSFGAVIIQFVIIGLATVVFGDTALVRQFALIGSIGFLILPYNWVMYNTFIWRGKR